METNALFIFTGNTPFVLLSISLLSLSSPSITGDAAPQALINIETDLSLKFILDTPLDALMAVEVSSKVVTDILAFLIECFLCAQRCLGGISVLPTLLLHLFLYILIRIFPFVILQEYLLVFSTFGVYVDSSGRRSRAMELMFPASPASGKVLDGEVSSCVPLKRILCAQSPDADIIAA